MKAILALLALGCGAALAAEPVSDARLEIRLANTRWQPLPLGIQQVRVGPDGRVWFQRGLYQRKTPPLAEIEQTLTREYGQPSPQVRDVSLELFEPDGRAWFFEPFSRTLLGYDGKKWIRQVIESPSDVPSGICPARGGLVDGRVHRAAGGAIWFITERGIYRFDGAAWNHQNIFEGKRSYRGELRLAVAANGKLAAAHYRGEPSLWVFRQGTWVRHEIFAKDDKNAVGQLVIGNQGDIWALGLTGLLRRWRLEPGGKLTEIEPDRTKPTATYTVGTIQVRGVQSICGDDQGRLFVAARSMGPAQSANGGGLLILNVDGTTRVFPDEKLALAAGGGSSWAWPPLLTPSGKQAWFPTPVVADAAQLFDFDSRQFSHALPTANFKALHAVDNEGRLYVGRSNPSLPYEPMMVYTPSAPALPEIQVLQREIAEDPVAVGDDGEVWAVDPEGQLLCFDRGQWQIVIASPPPPVRVPTDDDEEETPLPRRRLPAVSTILAGCGGVALVEIERQWTIFRGKEKLASGGLLELLEDHREVIGRAFGPGRSPDPAPGNLMLAATADGQLWWLQQHSLRLMVGEQWHDALDRLTAAGSRHGAVSYFAPIGDGGKIYTSDLSLRHDGGRSFFGEFKEGKLSFVDAPHANDRDGPLAIRDREQALWIRGVLSQSGGTSDHITGQTTVRVSPNGEVRNMENAGWPLLADEAGNIWLGDIRGKAKDRFNLWRGGQVVQELAVPGYRPGGLLFSNRPGSVHACTATGLQHLVANPPDFRQYRLGPVYNLPNTPGYRRLQAFSKQGFLVVATTLHAAQRTDTLYLIRVP